MKELQKKIIARIECAKEDLLRSWRLDYKNKSTDITLSAHLKGYLQALEHIKDLVDQEVELEEMRANLEAETLLRLEREGFKHDFPTR